MKRTALLLFLAGLNYTVMAAPLSFDFKDPKTVNNVVFRTDAPLESINGTATGISGTVTFDPAEPAATRGKIIVEAASLRVPNSIMEEGLQSDSWLDVAKYPRITFEVIGFDNVKTDGDKTAADVTGTFTLHGVSNKITIPVTMTFLKDRLHDRFPKLKGDLLVVRSSFTIKRSDYGINKAKFEDKVADEIQLTLSLAGQSPK
jgi:polyisoprenoid-binding protein YceI